MMPENQAWSAAGWGVALVALIGLLVRQIGPWRKQISEAEETIRRELHEQIDAFKEEIRKERLEHATEMRAFNLERDEMGDRLARMEKTLSRQQIKHNAERALDRHRLNNINACFDSLLMLLKANPEKSSEAVQMIEDMRAKQLLAEAEEKAIIRAAEIRADELEADHDGN
jgi:ABC-type multidrug transport system fused ATPase/permease subunit